MNVIFRLCFVVNFTASHDHTRLSLLAGLINAEVIAAWLCAPRFLLQLVCGWFVLTFYPQFLLKVIVFPVFLYQCIM